MAMRKLNESSSFKEKENKNLFDSSELSLHLYSFPLLMLQFFMHFINAFINLWEYIGVKCLKSPVPFTKSAFSNKC